MGLALPRAEPSKRVSLAGQMLDSFVDTFQELYGPENMSMCIHLLHHLPSDVRRFGPLQNHWMFLFESLGGVLKAMTGKTTTYNVAQRMINVISLQICLPILIKTLPKELPTQIRELFPHASNNNLNGLRGASSPVVPPILIAQIDKPDLVMTVSAPRCYFDGEEYHSTLWKFGDKSSSMYIQTDLNDFYLIHRFYGNQEASVFYAEVTRLQHHPNNPHSKIPFQKFYRVMPDNSNTMFLDLTTIKTKCSVKHEESEISIIPLLS